MAVKKAGWGLIAAGAAGIVLSLLIGAVLAGRADARPLQILGIEISAVFILLGLWRLQAETGEAPPRGNIRDLPNRILDLPTLAWVLFGFLLVYLLFFVAPIFLKPNLQMNFFARYIPTLIPIGNDLREMIGLIEGWAVENQSPYITQRFYPPLTYIVFTPFLLIDSYLRQYQLMTLLTLVSYCLLTLLGLRMAAKKHIPLALVLFITGLFSYGFQFELERGQFNVLMFLLCMASIYIFHYHKRYRLLAYLLFSLSIQLKLYPAIFIFMFVDDWRDWKKVILRFLGLGAFNFLLLFVLGYQRFWEFIRSVTRQMVNPSWIGPWNHSISSFISVTKQDGLGLMARETLRTFRHNAGWFEAALLLAFLVLFAAGLVIFHLRKESGLDPYLLLICTIGALILPISYDYTLSLLAVPMLLFLAGIPEMKNAWHKLISILLTVGISTAYALTLIPYNFRPHILRNSFPALFLILILVTVLNYMRYKTSTPQALTE